MTLTKKEKEILDNFKKAFPLLTERQKERLLYFGEGMAFKAEDMGEQPQKTA